MDRLEALILIPAFNEAAVIGDVIRQIRAAELPIRHEILVIDDGSTDKTGEVARAAGARAISLLTNLGYGYALRAGYQVALEEGVEIVIQLDGDGQHSPESIRELLRPVWEERADLVIGSRALSSVPYSMPLLRRFGQWFFRSLLRAMSGLRIGDPTSGFQVIGPRALELFTREGFPGDYPDADVLLYLELHGMRILEAPAIFKSNARGTSMHGSLRKNAYYVYKMLFSMFLVYLRHRHVRREGKAHESNRGLPESSSDSSEGGAADPRRPRRALDREHGPAAPAAGGACADLVPGARVGDDSRLV
jgi:glycosyltransferase involved in cell wall biosynthesis